MAETVHREFIGGVLQFVHHPGLDLYVQALERERIRQEGLELFAQADRILVAAESLELWPRPDSVARQAIRQEFIDYPDPAATGDELGHGITLALGDFWRDPLTGEERFGSEGGITLCRVPYRYRPRENSTLQRGEPWATITPEGDLTRNPLVPSLAVVQGVLADIMEAQLRRLGASHPLS